MNLQFKESQSKKSLGSCAVLRGSALNYLNLTNYILTKSLTNKKHLLKEKIKVRKEKPREEVLASKTSDTQNKLSEDTLFTESDTLPIFQQQTKVNGDDYYMIDDSNEDEEEALVKAKPKYKRFKRTFKKTPSIVHSIGVSQVSSQELIMKPEVKKNPQVSVFLLGETSSIETACNLSNSGLFVALVQSETEHPISINNIIQRNQKQTKQQNPDFMIVNY